MKKVLLFIILVNFTVLVNSQNEYNIYFRGFVTDSITGIGVEGHEISITGNNNLELAIIV